MDRVHDLDHGEPRTGSSSWPHSFSKLPRMSSRLTG
jgi:hypothetical protein